MILSSISIILTILSILLITFNVIKVRWYSLTIYIVGLLAVYSTTLVGLSVVGSDIPRELVMSKLAILNGWNTGYLEISNTSFVVGWLVPRLSEFFSIAPEWVYKVILPMIFACTPVLLYLIFRKQLNMPCSAPATHKMPTAKLTVISPSYSQEHHGSLKAFYAAMFFIIVPIYSLEIPTIGKSMVAETLMALCLWTMFTNWKAWQKCIIMTVLALFTIWAHYTVGIILIGILVLIVIITLISKLFKKWKLWSKRAISAWAIVVVIVITLPTSYVYYSKVSQGEVAKTVTGISSYYIKNVVLRQPLSEKVSPNYSTNVYNMTQQELKEYVYNYKLHESTNATPTTGIVNSDSIVQAGLGFDFKNTTPLGMVFRIIQYLTQLLIILGCIQLLLRYKRYKFNTEFIAGIGACLILLACCIFVPNFASLINMTRWYHASLFFLAPMFVLGFELLWIKK